MDQNYNQFQEDMNKHDERFDATLREQFADYAPPVAPAMWSRISQELNEVEIESTTAVPGNSRYKIWAAAASLLLFAGFGFLVNNHSVNTVKSTAVAIPAVKPAVSLPAKNETAVPDAVVSAPVESKVLAVKHSVAVKRESTPQQVIGVSVVKEEVPVSAETVVPVGDGALANNTPVQDSEMSNIPMYALNFLSTPKSLNDEITIIHPSTEKKKKMKGKENGSAIILLGKKYDRQPDIKYQIPYRF